MQRPDRRHLVAAAALCLFALPVEAISPGPPVVSSLFVPIEGDVLEPGTSNVLHLTGEVHVLTQAAFDDATGEWSVSFYGNLVRVRGTSPATGITWLGVGAQNVSWVGSNPGPPQDEAVFTFDLVGQPPGPPTVPPNPVLPVYFRDFVFAQEAGYEGSLQSVTASFVD